MKELLCEELEEERGAIAFSLLQEAVTLGKIVDFKVASNSMFPFLEIGDIATIRSIELRDLHKGDIIVYRLGNLLCVHRYIYNLKNGNDILQLIVKGDNVSHFDQPSILIGQLIGKVIAIKKREKTINLERGSWKVINYLIANISMIQGYVPAYLGFMRRVFLRNSKFKPGIFIREWICSLFFIPLRVIAHITKILT